MVRNPSEMARLYEELEYHKSFLLSLKTAKSDKEYHLAQIRKIEANLGIEGSPYNGSTK